MRERGKGLPIGIKRGILVTALLVGFCNTISVQAATPLMMTMEMKAQTHPKSYAYTKVLGQWNSKREYGCLVQLWEHESHWNPAAHNKSSGAWGIAQFMPQTWRNYHYPYKPKAATIQITAGLRYITKRYGSPCKAWAFWQRNAKKGNAWY